MKLGLSISLIYMKTQLMSARDGFTYFLFIFFIDVELIYNVSGVHHSGSAKYIYIYIYILF